MHQRITLAVALRDVDLALGAKREIVRFVKTFEMAGLMPLARAPFHTQHHEDAPIGGHLHHEMRAGVGGPDVAFAVDAQAVRIGEDPARHGAQIIAGVVEFHQRVFAAIKHQNIVFGVDGHAGARAEVHTCGQLKNISDGGIAEIGYGCSHDGVVGVGRSAQRNRSRVRRAGGPPQSRASSMGRKNILLKQIFMLCP